MSSRYKDLTTSSPCSSTTAPLFLSVPRPARQQSTTKRLMLHLASYSAPPSNAASILEMPAMNWGDESVTHSSLPDRSIGSGPKERRPPKPASQSEAPPHKPGMGVAELPRAEGLTSILCSSETLAEAAMASIGQGRWRRPNKTKKNIPQTPLKHSRENDYEIGDDAWYK